VEGGKLKQSILYIEQNRGIFYNLENPSMLQLDFPSDVVKDLDLVNKEKLYALIQAFVETYHILPTSITLVLSPNITFDKDIALDASESEVQAFTDLVPFQAVVSHIFSLGEKKKIVTANKELIDTIQRGFQKVHCDITAVLPYSIIQEVIPELANNFDLSLMLSKDESLKQYSMLETQQIKQISITGLQPKQKTDSKRLFVLLGVFGILLIIMVFMAIASLTPPSRKSVQGASVYKTPIPFYLITVGK